MTQQLFRPEAIEHRRQRLLGDIVLTQPPLHAAVTFLIVGAVLCAALALAIGSYSRTERVQGYLRPTGGFIWVVAAEAGTVLSVGVSDGENIDTGQPLLTVATEAYLSSGDTLATIQLGELDKQHGDLEARRLINLQRSDVEVERIARKRTQLESHLHNLKSRSALQNKITSMARAQVETFESLREQGYYSVTQLREHKSHMLAAMQMQAEIDSLISQTTAEIDELSTAAASTQLDLAQERKEIELLMSEVAQRRTEVSRDSSFVLKAPVTGQITALRATPGQTVSKGQTLLAILPNGEPLEAELLVPSQSVGRLQPGLEVKLRYKPFPHRRYGVYTGRLSTIAHSPVDTNDLVAPVEPEISVYPVSVKLDRQTVEWREGTLPLRAGMVLEADIVLEREPLWRVVFGSLVMPR